MSRSRAFGLPDADEVERRLAAADDDGTWSLRKLVAWLLTEGHLIGEPRALIDALADHALALGAPLWRLRASMRTIHPEIAAWGYLWLRDGGMTESRIQHGIEHSAAYIGSPIQKMLESGTTVRFDLRHLDPEHDHPVLHEVAADGGIDYITLPLVFSTGAINALVLVTDRASGFSDADIEHFEVLAHCLAPLLEAAATRRLARSLLDTYVGPRTGRRILEGNIRRGDGETLEAVIWFSDLRDFTPLTEHLAPAQMLEMLNAYFELVAAAVTVRGGEILRFIGDAMLIVFPASGEGGAARAAQAALDAAEDALDALGPVNHRRRRAGQPLISFGVGIHAGSVVYGNVGAPDRLDFTVMGPAVNRAARIETLTKSLGTPVLYSAAVARLLSRASRSLGHHVLKGVAEPQEVFTAQG